MKTVRVIVLVAMGVSAFCGFAQEIAPGAGASAGGAVVLNRTKAALAKPEIVPADKYPFVAIQKALEQGPGADIQSAVASVGLGAKVPPGWEPSKDVALSETAREAVALSAKLSNEQDNLDAARIAEKGDNMPVPSAAAGAPRCPVHRTPMAFRHGRFGPFWSCTVRKADGAWCPATQEVTPETEKPQAQA